MRGPASVSVPCDERYYAVKMSISRGCSFSFLWFDRDWWNNGRVKGEIDNLGWCCPLRSSDCN